MTVWIVFIGYVLMCMSLGVLGFVADKKKDSDGFFLGDRDIGWFLLGMTIMATYMSAFALLGIPAAVYKNGLPYMVATMLNVIVAMLVTWHVGRKIFAISTEKKYTTPADFFDDVYDFKPFRILVPILNVGHAVPYLAIQLIGGGVILNVLSEKAVSPEVGSVIVLFVLMFYGTIGGMRTIIWTDAIQGGLMFIGMWFGGYYMSFKIFNGPTDLWANVMEKMPEFILLPGPSGSWTWISIMSIGLMIGLGMFPGAPTLWLRLFSAKNLDSLRKSTLVNPYLVPIAFVIAIVPLGLGGYLAYPGLVKPDGLILHVILDHAPHIVVGLFFAAVLSGSMSTADSNLHAISAIFTIDVYKTFIKPDANVQNLPWVGRIAMIVIGVIGLVVSLTYPGMIYKMGFIALSVGIQLTPMTVGALFWKKAEKWGAFCGLVVGLTATILYLFVLKAPFGIHGGFFAFLLNGLVFVIVSSLAEPSARVLESQGKMDTLYSKLILEK